VLVGLELDLLDAAHGHPPFLGLTSSLSPSLAALTASGTSRW
jgi:hypothetical protein